MLSAERIERIFARHGNLFGGGVYSTVVTLWAFLGQVLRDGQAASCQSAVAQIVVHQLQAGGPVPTQDTGDYCRARAKLSVAALRDVAVETAAELEQRADPAWLWKGRHAQLIDGGCVTLPDTPENQAEFPQQRRQTPGVGLPIVRFCAILSLATACLRDCASGPYRGKETGETALLRELLDAFRPGDVAVADRYDCSFLMLALLLPRQVDVCTRLHQKRPEDFRRGRRLGKHDRLVVWTRPQRPAWMDDATYRTIHAGWPRLLRNRGGEADRGDWESAACGDSVPIAPTRTPSPLCGEAAPDSLRQSGPPNSIRGTRAPALPVSPHGAPGTVDHAAGLQPCMLPSEGAVPHSESAVARRAESGKRPRSARRTVETAG